MKLLICFFSVLVAVLAAWAFHPVDLYPTWIASKLLASGQLDGIYHGQALLTRSHHPAWMSIVRSNGLVYENSTFIYHPTYLWLLAPLMNILSPTVAKYTWAVLNGLSGALVVFGISRLAGIQSRAGVAALATLVIGATSSIYSFMLGQNILLLLGLALTSFNLLLETASLRRMAGAVVMAFAALAKPWAIALIPVIWLVSGWRLFLVSLVTFSGLTLVPFLFTPHLLEGYFNVIRGTSSVTVVPTNNLSFVGWLVRTDFYEWPRYMSVWVPFMIGDIGKLFSWAFSLIVFMAMVMLAYWRRPSKPVIISVALVLVIVPLSIVWSHYFVLALPLGVLLYVSCSSWQRWAGVAVLAVTVGIAVITEVVDSRFSGWAIEHPRLTAFWLFLPLLTVIIGACVALIVQTSSDHTGNGSQPTLF